MSVEDDAIAPTVLGPPTTSTGTADDRIESAAAHAHAVLAGRFELLGLLGAGGMGAVYRAFDRELSETVALKMLKAQGFDAAALDRFRSEVRLARRVSHRNVARVFELGEHDGNRFFTMELVEGASLRQVLARERRLTVERALEIARAITAGLGAAHEVGVIHRDLKPDNVMLAHDGRVAITDFGIAASLEGGDGTQTTSFAGTPQYMAPEQVDRSRPIDARSDLYALGVTLFELLTGKPPWPGETALAVAVARLTQPPPDPRAKAPMPDAIAELVLRLMARDPEERPASAAALEQELRVLSASLASASAVVTVRPPAPPPWPGTGPTSSSSTSSSLAPPSRSTGGGRVVRLALLPMTVHASAADVDLADGLTDDLIDALTGVRGLRVASRASTAGLGERGAADPRAVGERLGVDVVAEGSLRRVAAGRLRLSLRLITTADGLQIWARRFDVDEGGLLSANDEAAQAIARALTVEAPSLGRALDHPEAIELYLRARARLGDSSPESLQEATDLFSRAMAIAPEDPTLLAGHALALARLEFFLGTCAEPAERSARRALELAPRSAEAHLALGSVHLQRGRFEDALREGLVAVREGPSLADAHLLVGRILAETGPIELALRALGLSAELDPTIAFTHRERARALALAGRWTEARVALAEAELRVSAREQIGHLLLVGRLASWQRDAEGLARAREALHAMADQIAPAAPARAASARGLASLLEWRGRDRDPVEIAIVSADTPVTLRQAVYFHQVTAEMALLAGEPAPAERAVRRATAAGLLDLSWLDRCPLLEPLRSGSGWAELRAPVAARAEAVRAHLETPREGETSRDVAATRT